MIRPLIRKIYGNSIVFANLPGEKRAAYDDPEKIRARRDQRVRFIARYAAETVPHYRALFAEMKIDPREVRTADDLDLLPLLDKKTVQQDPDSFVSTSWLGKHSMPFATSGSTGLRLSIQHDPKSMLKNISFGERERQVLTNLCGRKLGYRELYLGHDQWTTAKVWTFYENWTFLPVRPQRLLLSVLSPIKHTADVINEFRPDIIVGWGSYLEFLFRKLALSGHRIHSPRLLNYGADSMTPDGRRFIEERFGVAVLSHYTAVECFKIGFFCEQARNFHVHEDLCHLRIVDQNGNPSPPGQKGEVVISNLINQGTVLLNYRLGDVGALLMEKCSCGRTLKLLSELEGRVEDMVVLPDGRVIPPRVIWSAIRRHDGILRYQLIQHEPLRFELKVLTARADSYERAVGPAIIELHKLLGDSSLIDVRYSEDLATPSTSKFRPVLSHCKPAL